MTMTNEELNTALYKKMFAQQEAFREELLQMPPEEILKHTYEYTVREDILLSLEYNDLPDKQARALLEAQESLWDIFHAFEKVETGYMDSIWQCVEERAEELLKQQELYHSDIYPHDAAYAIAHGELEQYRSSNKATLACKKAIEEAVSVHYHDNVLHKDAVAEVMQEFSNERIAEVLAITCRSLDQDRRISQENHEWARNVPVCRRSDGIGGGCKPGVRYQSGASWVD